MGVRHIGRGSRLGQAESFERKMLERRVVENAMSRSAADKFKEDIQKRVLWWQTEFELDHWSVVGVLMDVCVDQLFGMGSLDDDDDEDDDDEDEDE